jgi:hypothetical protein
MEAKQRRVRHLLRACDAGEAKEQKVNCAEKGTKLFQTADDCVLPISTAALVK